MNQEEEETDHLHQKKGIKIMKNEINILIINKSFQETIKTTKNQEIIKLTQRHTIIETSMIKKHKMNQKSVVDCMIPLHLTNQSEDVYAHQKNKKKKKNQSKKQKNKTKNKQI